MLLIPTTSLAVQMSGKIPMTSPAVRMSGTTVHIGTTLRVISPKIGPDEWPNWSHWNYTDGETSTSWKDLQSSEAQEQHAKDESYVEQYYNEQSERRKRYRVNHKEHVWQAQERLAMSFNDFRPAEKLQQSLRSRPPKPKLLWTSHGLHRQCP